MLPTIFFYLFSLVLVASAVAVVTARNPVHSVLCLILAFFNAAALFLIAGAEFLAMILVIVYVGAVAVLFLFVVMMLDVDFAQMREGFQRYAPAAGVVGLVLLAELGAVLAGWRFAPESGVLRMSSMPADLENTRALGRLIYTDYVFLFQASGLILMVAMIGAIVLTHRERQRSRRQVIARQVARTPADTLALVPMPLRRGVAPEDVLRPLPDAPAAPEPHDAQAQDAQAHGGHH
jgi:NADH-quinone oxidoreductase subunit J